jgi:hypothetical protein
MMYLQRHQILDIDVAEHEGKKFMWNKTNVEQMVDVVIPTIQKMLSQNQHQASEQ